MSFCIIMKKNCITKMYLSERTNFFFVCQKNANKDKGSQTIKNDERTTKAHKNPNGHSDRKENTNDDDSINSTNFS